MVLNAEAQGFEPWMTESESVALPLGDASKSDAVQIKNTPEKINSNNLLRLKYSRI